MLSTPTFGGQGSDGTGSGGFNWGSAAGGLGQIVNGIFGMHQPNPANSGMPYLNGVNQANQQAYGPWIQQGIGATQPYLQAGNQMIPGLQGAVGNLMNNPGAFVNQVGSNFHQSPGFQFQTQQALAAANAAGAAGGMAGSPMEQAGLAQTVNGLANQDYYNYLGNAMGAFNTGFNGAQNIFNQGAGIANNMYGVGANMASQQAQQNQQNATNQADLAYQGQVNQNQNQGGGIGSIIGGLGSLAASFL